jgi:transposase
VDRSKAGSKHHLLVDAGGIPLVARLTAANRNDITQLIPLVQGVPPIRGKVGAPLRRPRQLTADRGYDSDPHRAWLRAHRIKPEIARRGTEHGSGLGVARWFVEQTLALLHQFRRLRTRFEKRDDIHEAFLSLGCSVICWRRLNHGYF